MIKLYSDEDLWNAERQRRRLLTIFFIVLGVWAIVFSGFIVWYAMLPFHSPMQKWVIVATCVLTALFIAFAFPFMGISYKRCKAYVKMLKYISSGLKEYTVAPYIEVDDWLTRDGVDMNVANFSVPNVKRDGMMVRQIYLDGEKKYPPFEENKLTKLITQGNLLIAYEVVGEGEENHEA